MGVKYRVYPKVTVQELDSGKLRIVLEMTEREKDKLLLGWGKVPKRIIKETVIEKPL